MLGNFTYPGKFERWFIVADLVNVRWDMTAPVVSLCEDCGSQKNVLMGEI